MLLSVWAKSPVVGAMYTHLAVHCSFERWLRASLTYFNFQQKRTRALLGVISVASKTVISEKANKIALLSMPWVWIRLVKEHDLELSGAIEPTTLANCLDNCMEALNTQEAVNIVQYAAENQLKCAMPLALTLVNSKDIQLESAHKVLINSLFHYETKWVPV